jgi:hypothetical protein
VKRAEYTEEEEEEIQCRSGACSEQPNRRRRRLRLNVGRGLVPNNTLEEEEAEDEIQRRLSATNPQPGGRRRRKRKRRRRFNVSGVPVPNNPPASHHLPLGVIALHVGRHVAYVIVVVQRAVRHTHLEPVHVHLGGGLLSKYE